MNKAVITGRLVRNVELSFTPGTGKAIAKFTLAVDRKFKNKDGQKETDFIPCVVFGPSAEYVANYSSKGKLIGVSGRLQSGSYEKDGIKRYTMDVIVDEVEILEWDKKGQTQSDDGFVSPYDDSDDSIPF